MWEQTQNLQHIYFTEADSVFTRENGESESLSEAPLGLKHCLAVLKKNCSVLGGILSH